jgi:hypothetical protein
MPARRPPKPRVRPRRRTRAGVHERVDERVVHGLVRDHEPVEDRPHEHADHHGDVRVGRQLAALDATTQHLPRSRLALGEEPPVAGVELGIAPPLDCHYGHDPPGGAGPERLDERPGQAADVVAQVARVRERDLVLGQAAGGFDDEIDLRRVAPVPSTAAHCHPARATIVARGSARRLCTLREPRWRRLRRPAHPSVGVVRPRR